MTKEEAIKHLLEIYPFFQRLEPRARRDDFSKSLQAQIRDPLWMLARQWQFGEFIGCDAGSPAKAQISYKTTKANQLQVDGEKLSLNENIPLEVLIERERMSTIDLQLGIRLGKQLEKQLKKDQLSQDKILDLRSRFPFPKADNIELDQESQKLIKLVKGKIINGKTLYEDGWLQNISLEKLEDWKNWDKEEKNIFTSSIEHLSGWFRKVFNLPINPGQSSWDQEEMSHKFTLSAPPFPGEKREQLLTVDDYKGGKLDWINFKVKEGEEVQGTSSMDAKEVKEGEEAQSIPSIHTKEVKDLEFLPTNLAVPGTPHPRWWMMEDSKVDIGDVNVNTNDLTQLLLLKFMLSTSNNWYRFPLPLAIGSLCKIFELKVIDSFGEAYDFGRAVSQEVSGQKWEMFALTKDIDDTKIGQIVESLNKPVPTADFLFLPPTLGRSETSKPIEEVLFRRDERFNAILAREERFLNELGWSRIAAEENRQTDSPQEKTSDLKEYRLYSSFPDGWVPFVPVAQIDKDLRYSVRYQRAQVPSTQTNGGEEIRSKSQLLNGIPKIKEGVVSHSGLKLVSHYQRSRWIDGSTWLWKGRKIAAGKGVGNSGVKHDYLKDGDAK